ncbi:iron chaperone [Loigolactobacillus jiayinensis]|uniref:Iron chaperone n=1 Tax=Loigolactobacillus jiayinensis TaxID=2486016 RepID=A0ABW1RFD8_9LACO|nr:iron chaperone [Loigolactobacillus jiayinensis]
MPTAPFADYLAKIAPEQRERTTEILDWVSTTYPQLVPRVAWNQPMFTDHGTFIIGFSNSKKHLAVSPEAAGISHFAPLIEAAGYPHTKNLMQLPWASAVNYDLLAQMINFNLSDKADTTTFWRK